MSYQDYLAGYEGKIPHSKMDPDHYKKGKSDRDQNHQMSPFEFTDWQVSQGMIPPAHPAAESGAQREKLNTLPYDLVPFQEITDAFTRVAEFGAVKYEPWNWSKGLKRVQLLGSLLRHAFAYLRGQDRDADSGLLHTDHILWNAAALCHNVAHDLEDGRRKEPPRDYYKK